MNDVHFFADPPFNGRPKLPPKPSSPLDISGVVHLAGTLSENQLPLSPFQPTSKITVEQSNKSDEKIRKITVDLIF